MNVYDLNTKQLKAVSKLKNAFKDCKRTGIVFINKNGRMTPFSSEYVKSATDIQDEGDLSLDLVNINSFDVPINQWIDCDVFLLLTESGLNQLNQQL